MDYFTEIPRTFYPSLTEDNTSVMLTNILTKSAFIQEVLDNTSVFYEYSVREGETPEIIADKLYGDAKRYWIVLLFNKLNNPYYDFPLVQEQLNVMIEEKYGQTIEQSQQTIHHYEERITYTTYYLDMVQSSYTTTITISEYTLNSNTGIVTTRVGLPGTADTTLPGSSYTEDFGSGVKVIVSYEYAAVSNYSYELTENEKRRNIRLLDRNYVGMVESEFRRLMRDGN